MSKVKFILSGSNFIGTSDVSDASGGYVMAVRAIMTIIIKAAKRIVSQANLVEPKQINKARNLLRTAMGIGLGIPRSAGGNISVKTKNAINALIKDGLFESYRLMQELGIFPDFEDIASLQSSLSLNPKISRGELNVGARGGLPKIYQAMILLDEAIASINRQLNTLLTPNYIVSAAYSNNSAITLQEGIVNFLGSRVIVTDPWIVTVNIENTSLIPITFDAVPVTIDSFMPITLLPFISAALATPIPGLQTRSFTIEATNDQTFELQFTLQSTNVAPKTYQISGNF